MVGTIGIGLVGIAQSIHMNPAITAGAVISGAYFGDTTSPLSDSANLAAGVAGVNLYEHVRETALTSSVALAIALAVFWMLGRPADFDTSAEIAAIENTFNISLVLFPPLVIVVGLALLKFPPFTSIFIGAIVVCGLAMIVAPARVISFAGGEDLSAWLALIKGGGSHCERIRVDDRLRGNRSAALARRHGGMLDTIWLVVAALAFGGVVEKAGVLDKLITPVIDVAKSSSALIASMVELYSPPTSPRPISISRSSCRDGCSRTRSHGSASRLSCCQAPLRAPRRRLPR